MSAANPIGVFDSGVGGLSVLREIRRELPGEKLLYVADSAYAPYGEKSERFIEERSLAIAEFLVSQQAKAIVVACNTATTMAVKALRERFAIPIIAMEPALKPAAAQTRSGIIGVLATRRTLASEHFTHLRARYSADAEILAQPCPGWVEQVEAGDLDGDRTRELVEAYVRPLLEQGTDTLVLGCTHYPFLAALIRLVAGPDVTVIDPAVAVARQLKRRLDETGQLNSEQAVEEIGFWSSGSATRAERIMSQLWLSKVAVRDLPAKYRHSETTVLELPDV